MIKLCVFDVDGTLVTKKDRKAAASTIETLKALRKAGVKIAIASGRPPFAMEKSLLDQVDFDYFICSNGACVQANDGHILHKFQFTQAQTQLLIDQFKRTDNALMFQCVEAAHCYHGYKRIANMLSGFLGRLDILVDEREHETYMQSDLPLAAVAKIENQDKAWMQEQFPDFLFTPFDDQFYDINGQHTKATGIQYICDEIGCTMAEAAAFGDDMNDLAMITECGYGIAMGNAREPVKQAARYVTASVDEDGIALACQHFGWVKL